MASSPSLPHSVVPCPVGPDASAPPLVVAPDEARQLTLCLDDLLEQYRAEVLDGRLEEAERLLARRLVPLSRLLGRALTGADLGATC